MTNNSSKIVSLRMLTALLVSCVFGASIANAHPWTRNGPSNVVIGGDGRPRRLNDVGIVGGYAPVEDFETNEGVNAAATFVLQEVQSGNSTYSELFFPQTYGDISDVEVVGANQQVVAGMNYQLDLVFRDSSGACLGGGTVVVYDRFGELSITQWEAKESLCDDADPPGSTDESAAATDRLWNPRGSLIQIVPMMAMMTLLLLLVV